MIRVLNLKIPVPNEIYCGFSGLAGQKCQLCVKVGVNYYCTGFKSRLTSDVCGPLRCDKCIEKAKLFY